MYPRELSFTESEFKSKEQNIENCLLEIKLFGSGSHSQNFNTERTVM